MLCWEEVSANKQKIIILSFDEHENVTYAVIIWKIQFCWLFRSPFFRIVVFFSKFCQNLFAFWRGRSFHDSGTNLKDTNQYNHNFTINIWKKSHTYIDWFEQSFCCFDVPSLGSGSFVIKLPLSWAIGTALTGSERQFLIIIILK